MNNLGLFFFVLTFSNIIISAYARNLYALMAWIIALFILVIRIGDIQDEKIHYSMLFCANDFIGWIERAIVSIS